MPIPGLSRAFCFVVSLIAVLFSGVCVDSQTQCCIRLIAQSSNHRAGDPQHNRAIRHAQTHLFRGNIDDRYPIIVNLVRAGKACYGSYSYEGTGKKLTLKGSIGPHGDLTLREYDPDGKQTGRFTFSSFVFSNPTKAELPESNMGEWSSLDGHRKYSVELTEEWIHFTDGLHVTTKRLEERSFDLVVLYPQLAGGHQRSVTSFNRKAASLVEAAVHDYKQEQQSSHRYQYRINYSVLLATDDVFSVEIDTYLEGGAYPTGEEYPLTYDLRSGRAMPMSALFKPHSGYQRAIRRYCLTELNRELRSDPNNKPANLLTDADIKNKSDWAMARRGIVIYFDFPHYMAALDRVFVPYRVLEKYLAPQGPAAKIRAVRP
jgi:hypothetical protein